MTFKDAIHNHIQFQKTLVRALDKFCEDSSDPNLENWYAHSLYEAQNGDMFVTIHWVQYLYHQFDPDIYGEKDVPLEAIIPYIQTQYELDEFDRQLEEGAQP